jgi:dihydroflavonol-4-reductase
MAEKAAWDFVEKLPENEKIELVIINPSAIMGPNFVTGDFTSGLLISTIMKSAFPGMPKV